MQVTSGGQARSCTGLLDDTFLDRLAGHADRFPFMASELTQLRAVTEQTRRAEKALTTAAAHPGGGIDPARVQAARTALRAQVQRMQLVLQGHRTDLSAYTPVLSKVTHESTCQADWMHLQRVLKSIDAVSTAVTTVQAPTEAKREQAAARRWTDLCGRRQRLSQELRSVRALIEQADWGAAGDLLRAARPELRCLLTDARNLAASGEALLLNTAAYQGLDKLLRDIPQHLDNLDQFQVLIDRQRRG